MKVIQTVEYNKKNIFFEKSNTKNMVENYSQTPLWKIKIDHISESIVNIFLQFFYRGNFSKTQVSHGNNLQH